MAEKSTRTKMIEETKVDDDMPMVKKAVRAVTLGASKMADKLGFTQEKEYSGKSKDELKMKNSDLAGKKEKDVEALNELKRESRGQYKPERFKVPEKLKAKGGAVKYKKGGVTRADGICKKGHTKGKMV